MQGWLKKYKVILILFIYLATASLLYALLTEKNPMIFLMGLFFIVFSFFKIIHLAQFQASFSKYDVIAQIVPYYAILTIIILVSTNIGVIKALRKGQIFECACLGVVFNLPLSSITVFENTLMIIMATMQVYLLF